MAAHQARCTARGGVRTGRTPPPVLRTPSLRTRAVAGSGVEQAGTPHAPPKLVVVETTLLGAWRGAVELGSGQAPAGSLPGASSSNGGGSSSSSSSIRGSGDGGGPLAAVRAFFLPTGWPHSVTPDYLRYQLASVPAHITGWMSHSLATSSMITALGVDAGPATIAATSAAVKWLTKDGLGAAGRLIVGGRLSSVFDEDPKRWRMVAEGVTTVGLAMEIATQIYPAYFIALAGTGTLCKSMAKGMGTPCFRIIQTHFSATNNVGDVAAKEEVWEVAAQLLGLAASVVALQALEAAGSPDTVVPVWMAVHAVHCYLRYAALSSLLFPYPNQKRAALMASSHVRTGLVPSVEQVNLSEQVLLPPTMCQPSVHYGCTLDQALGSGGGGFGGGAASGGRGQQLAELVRLYDGEQYMLTWHRGAAWVLVLEGAQRADLLRAMWQAAWLEEHHQQQGEGLEQQQGEGPAPSDGSGGSVGSVVPAAEVLAASLAAMQQQWPDFLQQAQEQGWLLDKTVLPQGTARLRVE